MAELTFTLKHGLRTGKGTSDEMLHKDVTLRELTSVTLSNRNWPLNVSLSVSTARRSRTALR